MCHGSDARVSASSRSAPASALILLSTPESLVDRVATGARHSPPHRGIPADLAVAADQLWGQSSAAVETCFLVQHVVNVRTRSPREWREGAHGGGATCGPGGHTGSRAARILSLTDLVCSICQSRGRECLRSPATSISPLLFLFLSIFALDMLDHTTKCIPDSELQLLIASYLVKAPFSPLEGFVSESQL